jgi:hypothetical protein
MTPRTTALSVTEPTMWRKLLARTHPDAGGDHDLFVWVTALQECVAHGTPSEDRAVPRPRDEHREKSGADYADRVYLHPRYDFQDATFEALRRAGTLPSPFAELLLLLADIEPAVDEIGIKQQNRGATYKSLAALGHRVGLAAAGRQRLYEIAQEIPLSQRHVGHMFARTK